MKGIFCFKVKLNDGTEGVWVVDAKNGSGSVKFGAERKYWNHHCIRCYHKSYYICMLLNLNIILTIHFEWK